MIIDLAFPSLFSPISPPSFLPSAHLSPHPVARLHTEQHVSLCRRDTLVKYILFLCRGNVSLSQVQDTLIPCFTQLSQAELQWHGYLYTRRCQRTCIPEWTGCSDMDNDSSTSLGPSSLPSRTSIPGGVRGPVPQNGQAALTWIMTPVHPWDPAPCHPGPLHQAVSEDLYPRMDRLL